MTPTLQAHPLFEARMVPTGRPGEFGFQVSGPIHRPDLLEEFVFGIMAASRQKRKELLAEPKIQTPTPEQAKLLVG